MTCSNYWQTTKSHSKIRNTIESHTDVSRSKDYRRSPHKKIINTKKERENLYVGQKIMSDQTQRDKKQSEKEKKWKREWNE